jgi:hypothetical protein
VHSRRVTVALARSAARQVLAEALDVGAAGLE